MHHDTRDTIANRPEYHDTHGLPLPADDTLSVSITFDDITTIARAYVRGHAVAAGVARRHPKDARNPHLGQSLALARLFQNLHEFYVHEAHIRLHPAPEPDAAMVKALRKGAKAEAKAKKDARRRDARERFKREASQQVDASPAEREAWRARTFGDWQQGHA